MFRSVFTKSLRDYRWAILGWGLGLGLLIFVYYGAVSQVLAGTPPQELQQLAQQFNFFGETVKANTPGGYVTFKIMGSLPVVLGIWTLLAGARMTRGDEERGTMDVLLSTPQSRLGLLGQKVGALAAATGLISLLIGLLTMAGMPSAKVTVDPGAALLAGFNAGLTAFVFGALALLLAQFMSRGAAAGWTGGLMAFFFVLEGTGRSVSGASGVRPFTPLYYYDQNLPLVPGFATNWGALAVLVVICLVLVGVALPLFVRRDIGRTVQADALVGQRSVRTAPPVGEVLARAEGDVWQRGVAVHAVRRQGAAMFWWIVALAVLAGFFVLIAKTTEEQLVKLLTGSNSSLSTTISQLFSGADISTNSGFLAVLVFGYMPLLLPLFTGIIAYRWATDLDNGRLELVLAQPLPRWRVLLERYAAVLAAAVIATLAIWLAVVVCAQIAGFAIDGGRVAEASLGMLPLALITGALVFALAGLLPPGAVIGIMAAFLGVSFLADILKTLLKLPDWALNLSIFHQYGTPVLNGLNWGAFVGMLVVAAILLGLGIWQFSTRDLDRGVVES